MLFVTDEDLKKKKKGGGGGGGGCQDIIFNLIYQGVLFVNDCDKRRSPHQTTPPPPKKTNTPPPKENNKQPPPQKKPHNHTHTKPHNNNKKHTTTWESLWFILTVFRYFDCKPLHGLFAPVHKVTRLAGAMSLSTPSPMSRSLGSGLRSARERSGSQESVSSISSSASSVSRSRVRLGVTSLASQVHAATLVRVFSLYCPRPFFFFLFSFVVVFLSNWHVVFETGSHRNPRVLFRMVKVSKKHQQPR